MTQSDKERMEALAEREGTRVSCLVEKSREHSYTERLSFVGVAETAFKNGYLAARSEPGEREAKLVEAAYELLDHYTYDEINNPKNNNIQALFSALNAYKALKAYEDDK